MGLNGLNPRNTGHCIPSAFAEQTVSEVLQKTGWTKEATTVPSMNHCLMDALDVYRLLL